MLASGVSVMDVILLVLVALGFSALATVVRLARFKRRKKGA